MKSSRFGWEVHTPLQAAWIPADTKGRETAAERSFLEVDAPNVIIQALKMAEDGNGLILRLRELAGRKCEARLKSAFLEGPSVAAKLVDTEWAEGSPVEITHGAVTVQLPAYGIQTLRIVRPK